MARAIEPFFSTKGVGKGTGLGVSMVHGLASQLGGALAIRSRPGRGTEVELWLPQSAGGAETAHSPTIETPVLEVRGTVLLVEDEDIVRMSTADMLNELGFDVVEAASAEAALPLLDDRDFDVIITDHLMPGMSGVELARLVRSRSARTPILLISGYAEEGGVDASLPRLTKPFRKDELAAGLALIAPAPD